MNSNLYLNKEDIKEDELNFSIEDREYFDNIIDPISRLEGNELPVSAFDPRGIVPTNTTRFEKRGVATELPCWQSDKCIQCNMCAFVCPHAAIRPALITKDNLANAPESLKTAVATGEKDLQFVNPPMPKIEKQVIVLAFDVCYNNIRIRIQ